VKCGVIRVRYVDVVVHEFSERDDKVSVSIRIKYPFHESANTSLPTLAKHRGRIVRIDSLGLRDPELSAKCLNEIKKILEEKGGIVRIEVHSS